MKEELLIPHAATGKFDNFSRKTLKEFITSRGHKLLDKISANEIT